MKQFKVIISTLLVFTVIVSSIISAYGISSANVLDKQIEINKISSDLQSVVDKLDDEDRIKVAVWLCDIQYEVKNRAFLNQLSKEKDNGNISDELYSKVTFSQNETKTKLQELTLNEAQVVSSNKRAAYKGLHVDRNTNWKNNIDKKTSNTKVIYSSSYAPIVLIESTKTELNKIAMSEEVEYIELWNEELIPVDSETQTGNRLNNTNTTDYGVWQNITNIYTMRDVMGYDGQGIRIGLLDNGLPELNYSSGLFDNSTIIKVNNGDVDPHATNMAAILVGKTNDFTGVVPNADLYCACYDEMKSSYIIPIDTLISNNINILCINVALGEADNVYNTYDKYAKYLDYIVYNYNITICKSAGNFGLDFGVPEGGMGYNLITVGNLDDNNSLNRDRHSIYNTSSYLLSETEAYKPDICAPGARVGTPIEPDRINDKKGGTSSAATVVAGTCAMLMQAEPNLVMAPMLLKSILMSSAKRLPEMDSIISTSTTESPALSRQAGAGLVDVTRAHYLAEHEKWDYIPLVSADQSQNPYVVNVLVSQNSVNSSKSLAVCITWTQKVISTELSHSTVYNVYHHNLGVYDPNGNLVANSDFLYDRKQFVYFKPSVAGIYQIRVLKTGTASSGVLTSISYNLS